MRMRFTLLPLLIIPVLLLMGCSNNDGSSSVTLEKIQVEPFKATLDVGTSQQYTATAIYSNGDNKDVSDAVTWSSSKPAVASIDEKGVVRAESEGSAIITALIGTMSGTAQLQVEDKTVSTIVVYPSEAAAIVSITRQFTAIANFSDNTYQDITKDVIWNSSETNIASVSNDYANAGKATANSQGLAEMGATFDGNDGTSLFAVLNAQPKEINIVPFNAAIPKATDQQFAATLILDNNEKIPVTDDVLWSSSDSKIASISNAQGSNGLASGNDLGTVSITATLTFAGESYSASATLTITAATPTSLQVIPADKTVPKGATGHYTATVYYADNSSRDVTKESTWESSNTEVVHITTLGENAGYAQALESGTSTITAYFEGKSDSTGVTVTAPTLESIQVTPVNESIAKGLNVQYSAIGIYSDNTKADLTQHATWQSSDTAVATIDPNGKAHSVDVGTATISASFEGHSNSTDLTVTAATSTSMQATPANKTVPKGATWESSNTDVAYITTSGESAGYAEALESGTSTIASYFEGKSDSTGVTVTAATLDSIQVTPVNESVAKGLNVQYSAIGIYSDNTKMDLTQHVAWKSSNTAVATIASHGKAYGVDVGSATISASFEGQSNSTDLTVLAKTLLSIQLTADEESIQTGSSTQMHATGIYSDNTNEDITKQATWTSSDTSVAIVHNDAGNEGLVEGLNAGNTDIKADFSGIASTMQITVTAITLDHININGPRYVIVGTEGQYYAEGVYSDGSSKDMTTEVLWGATPQDVATISNANGSQGKLTGLGVGQATVTASTGGVSGQYQMDVTEPSLESIVVTPANSTIHQDTWIQFTATGHYSNGFEEDITTSVLWQSSDNTKIYLYNDSGYEGYGVAYLPGTVTISATSSSVVGNTQLTIIAVTLQSIDISPLNATVVVGTHLQYTATGNYSDGSTEDLTSEVTWIARPTNTDVISITQEGLLSGLRVGNADIDAALDTITGTTPVTVEDASLISIEVTPADTTLRVNKKQKYTATGHFSNGTTQKISKDVVWESSDENVASFEKKESVKAHNVGITTISASMEGISGNTPLTVTD